MTGRWPTNVILSPAMAEAVDQQSGNRPGAVSNGPKTSEGMNGTGTFKIHAREQKPGYADQGGASRFFVLAGYEPWELEWIIANGLTPCGT